MSGDEGRAFESDDIFAFTETLRIDDDGEVGGAIEESQLPPLEKGVEDILGDRGVLVKRLGPPENPESQVACESHPFVELHYEAFVVGGDRFDTTRDQNYPLIVQLDIPPSGSSTVIRAWEAALVTVRAGEKLTLTAAARYAYGKEGSPDGGVPASSDVRYEMEILDVRATRKRVVTVDRSKEDLSRLDAIRLEREVAAQRRLDEQELKEAEKKKKAEKAAALKEKLAEKKAGGKSKGKKGKKGKK